MKIRRYDVLGRKEDVEAVLSSIKKRTSQFKQDRTHPDFHIVVGGDGVILYKEIKGKILDGRPILRVHHRKNSDGLSDAKSLGFTADLTLENLHQALEDIAKDEYFTKEEKLLDCFINSKKRGTAIYDISIKPRESFSALLFEAVLSGYGKRKTEKLPSPKCDLLLVSTKYGSTAWNLSVGGPINIDVEDCTHINFVGAPIMQSHYIYGSERALHLKMYSHAFVGLDGLNPVHRVDRGDRIDVKESGKRIVLLRTRNTSESLMDKVRRQNVFNLDGVMESGW